MEKISAPPHPLSKIKLSFPNYFWLMDSKGDGQWNGVGLELVNQFTEVIGVSSDISGYVLSCTFG